MNSESMFDINISKRGSRQQQMCETVTDECLLCSGFASSSAVFLFLSIVSHLTSAGTDWAGSVSIAAITVLHSLSILPSSWFLTAELSPVYHMVWSVPLGAAAHWGPALVSVMLFPLAVQVRL